MRNPKYLNFVDTVKSNNDLKSSAALFLYYCKVQGKSIKSNLMNIDFHAIYNTGHLLYASWLKSIDAAKTYWPESSYYNPALRLFDNLELEPEFKNLESEFGAIKNYKWDVKRLNQLFMDMTNSPRPIKLMVMAGNNKSKVPSGYSLICKFDEIRQAHYFQLIHTSTCSYVNSGFIKNPTIKRAIRFLRNNVKPEHKGIESDNWCIQIMIPTPTFASWYVVYFDACTGDLSKTSKM